MARIIPIRVDRLLSNRLPNQPSAFEMKTITDDTNNAIYLSIYINVRLLSMLTFAFYEKEKKF